MTRTNTHTGRSVLNLPRPAVSSRPGDEVRRQHVFHLDEETVTSLRRLCGQHDVPVSIALLAMLNILLARYTGQDAITVTAQLSSPSAESARAPAPALAISSELPRHLTATDLMKRLWRRIAAAHGHPESVDAAETPSRDALSGREVLFVMADEATRRVGANECREIPSADRYGIVLSFTESDSGLRGAFSCHVDCLDEATAGQLARHMTSLIQEVVVNPSRPLSSLHVLDMSELRRTVIDWNNTATTGTDSCIHHSIEQQVLATPDRVALSCGTERLTYHELNATANRLAHYLRRRGVGPEVLVGVFMEQATLDSVVAILGILKAGGVHLTLNPSQPDHRLQALITISGVHVVLTDTTLAHRLGTNVETVLLLDRIRSDIAAEEPTNPHSGVDPESSAFVRFTSGSTGEPKCVVNVHRAITNRLRSLPLPDIQEGDVCALYPSLVFLSRLLFPLALGATIVMIDAQHFTDAPQLADLVLTRHISSIFLSHGLLRDLLTIESPVTPRLAGLRAVAVAGERLTPDLVTLFMRTLPHALLVNLYGFTEIGTTAACAVTNERPSVPSWIGRPVANTRIYVLDKDMNPLPVNVAGEIYLGAAHLSRGYLGRAAMTAERFVADPFGMRPGSRLYRTGDLGRYLGDGHIEFLGRADNQVKLGGWRVELEEIEAALAERCGVDSAVGVCDSDRGECLIAYVVGDAATLTAADVCRRLGEVLPYYMVPREVIVVEHLPRLPNGKLDRAALPRVRSQSRAMTG